MILFRFTSPKGNVLTVVDAEEAGAYFKIESDDKTASALLAVGAVPLLCDALTQWHNKRYPVMEPAAPPPPAEPSIEGWHCGNRHLAAERLLRLVEQLALRGTALVLQTLDYLADEVQRAGPANAQRSLAASGVPYNELPF